jgi:hypothetical protein
MLDDAQWQDSTVLKSRRVNQMVTPEDCNGAGYGVSPVRRGVTWRDVVRRVVAHARTRTHARTHAPAERGVLNLLENRNLFGY